MKFDKRTEVMQKCFSFVDSNEMKNNNKEKRNREEIFYFLFSQFFIRTESVQSK